MLELIFIGTLHNMFETHRADLELLLNTYKPQVLLIEVTQTDLEQDRIDDYPDEMKFAAKWAQDLQIPVMGFDSPIYPVKEGITEEEISAATNEQLKILEGKTWRDANCASLLTRLQSVSSPQIDQAKSLEREMAMLANIRKALPAEGRVLVLTGVGHMPFFTRKLPSAQFPLWRPHK